MTMDWEVDKVLGIFKKKISVCAPFDGRTMDMTEVRDPVFAQLMMGDGCALIPASGDVLAPEPPRTGVQRPDDAPSAAFSAPFH